MGEATEIAKLRLFLSLVASAKTVEDLEPLPNVDFNIMAGNSLIGLIQIDGNAFNRLEKEESAISKLTSPRLKNIQKLLKKANLEIQVTPEIIELGYQYYRLGIRTVIGATNERALVTSIIPKNVFAGNSLMLSIPIEDGILKNKLVQKRMYSSKELLGIVTLL